ncbi:MAG TPA: hypothetical protein VFO15_15445, partial [Xanthobacteraceae bacterium]|nr:hypothetical protein [Xanthobacteraceae bacterium]
FIPGVLLYVLLASVCWGTSWCSLAVPTKWEDLFGLAGAAALAFPYCASRVRNKMNQFYLDQVNENLVQKLTVPFANDPTVPRGLTWRHIDPVFYNLVNSDKALTHHARRAFRNGALWTSAADLRAISLIGILVFVGALLIEQSFEAAYFPPHRAVIGILTCILLASLSFPISSALTRKQIAIGNKQVDHIMTHV